MTHRHATAVLTRCCAQKLCKSNKHVAPIWRVLSEHAASARHQYTAISSSIQYLNATEGMTAYSLSHPVQAMHLAGLYTSDARLGRSMLRTQCASLHFVTLSAAAAGTEVPDIYVTGHSLGGALAALFTTAWCSDNPGLGPKVLALTWTLVLCAASC